MKKKLIIVILLIQILFNFFLSNFSEIYAYDSTSSTSYEDMKTDQETVEETLEDGSANVGSNGNKSIVASDSVIRAVTNGLIRIVNILPTFVRTFLQLVTEDDDILSKYGLEFSMQKVIFGQIEIFDIDYFDNNDNANETIKTLRKSVATMFVLVRNIAIVLNLIILIYAGIRMAISSVAQEKAKYKRVIMDWLFSFILLMTIQIIMVAGIEIVKYVNQFLVSLYETLGGSTTIEATIAGDVFSNSFGGAEIILPGFSLIVSSVLYWVLTFYQLKFALMYFNRVLSVGFLIVISPLVISSYSLDKAGDGEAQALKSWGQEFVTNLVMQPVHIILFSLFFIMADNIIEKAPLVSIFLIVCMTQGEKIVRNMLRVKDAKSIESMEGSMISFANMNKMLGGKTKKKKDDDDD